MLLVGDAEIPLCDDLRRPFGTLPSVDKHELLWGQPKIDAMRADALTYSPAGANHATGRDAVELGEAAFD